MNRPLLIVNPRAGLGLYQKHIPVVLNRLSAAGVVPAVYISQHSGDARRASAEMAGEYDAIICYGGDGTLNEVVAGILDSGTGRTVGYIPAGSTNLPLERNSAKSASANGTPPAPNILAK